MEVASFTPFQAKPVSPISCFGIMWNKMKVEWEVDDDLRLIRLYDGTAEQTNRWVCEGEKGCDAARPYSL